MAQVDSELGPQGDFATLGLETNSHKDHVINAAKNDCEIKFKSSKPVRFTCQLVNTEKPKDDLSSYVFSQRYEKCLHFVIQFPESGNYKFSLFALPGDTKETSLPNVFNYMIKVTNANKAVYGFPKQYAQWKDGCYIHEPMVLNSHCSLTNVNFKIGIPNAKAAAIVVNGKEWNHLEKKDGCFVGKLDLHKLRNTSAKVTLNANFEEGSTSYPTLLEYNI